MTNVALFGAYICGSSVAMLLFARYWYRDLGEPRSVADYAALGFVGLAVGATWPLFLLLLWMGWALARAGRP